MADNKELGRIHIYCGNGKGKTTCGMGLCVRAAGYGFRVLIYQFMKNNATSERAAMEHLENITFLPGLEHEKFSMRMTEEEKRSGTLLRSRDAFFKIRMRTQAVITCTIIKMTMH